MPPRKFVLHECSVLFYLFIIILDGILSPGQLKIPALRLAIDLSFLFSSVQSLSRVRLCATPEMAAHQAPPFLGFSRQEHWSGLPFPSPMHESEK